MTVLFPNVPLSFFGVTGDGVTDDTVAFQSAIDAASACGGKIGIPNGTYKMTSSLSVTGNVTFEGDHKLGTVVNFAAGVVNGFICPTMYQSVHFSKFSVSGPDAVGIQLGDATIVNSESTISGMRFPGCKVGIDAINSTVSHIENNELFQCSTSGIRISSPLNVDGGDSWLNNNHFLNYDALNLHGTCIDHISGGGWKIASNKGLGCQYGYALTAVLGDHVSSSYLIHDNSFEGMSVAPIALRNTSATVGNLLNVKISNNQLAAAPGAVAGIWIGASGARKWISKIGITGNIINNVSSGSGINMDGAKSLNISGNTIGENGTPAGWGIIVGPNSSDGLIIGNTVTDYGGCKVLSQGTNIIVVNNGP